MTSRILLFDPVERFVAGTVGQPGERTFFIQARTGSRLISVSLEKTQVQALSERLTYMIREIKQSDPTIVIQRLTRDDAPLETPIEEEFRIGVIGIAFDASRELIQIDLQAVSEGDEEELEFIDVDDLTGDQDIMRVLISPSMAEQFAKRAMSVVSAGRLPCPFCGGPIDMRGHLCPRANGYRR
ncbi:Protein of unknown function DUF3090 [Candidatus Nanopelagicaceae bacterium]